MTLRTRSANLGGTLITSNGVVLGSGLSLSNQANAAYAQANTGYSQANAAYAQANAAFNAANNARVTVSSNGGSSLTTQNINFVNTSTVSVSVTNSSSIADVSFIAAPQTVVNDTYTAAGNTAAAATANIANGLYAIATAAYSTANSRLSTSGGSISGDLAITGNLTVTGNATTINVSNLSVNDSMILLSTNAVGDSNDIGFIGHFDRGATATHAGLIRKATQNQFYLFDNYEVEPTNNVIDVTGNNFRVGNLRLGIINANSFVTSAGLNVTDQANSAFAAANNRVLKAGDTMTGSLVLGAGRTVGNGGIFLSHTGLNTDVLANGRTAGVSTGWGTFRIHQEKGNPGLIIAGDASQTAPYMRIQNNAESALVVVDSAGNLGIGTASPLRKLDVFGGGIAITESGGTSGRNIHWGDSSTGIFPVAIGASTTSGGVFLTFSTNTFGNTFTERMRLDSSGRLLIGSTAARTNLFNSTNASPLQVEGTSFDTSSILAVRNENNSSASALVLGKTRGTTVGSTTVVANGDGLGLISFQGSDGTEFVEAARIQGLVDGDPGANDMPGRIIFSTTADGAAGVTERMRINSSGDVGIGTASPTQKLAINSVNTSTNSLVEYKQGDATQAYVGMGSDNILRVESLARPTGVVAGGANHVFVNTNGSERVRVNSSGDVGIGTASPGVKLDVAGSIRASQSIIIGNGGGTYQAGSIYSDSNWGMIFRAAQASPGIAQFSWHNSADTVLMRMDPSGHTTHVGRFGVNNAATDTTFVFAVASGRTRLQANSEQYALGLRYNTTTGYYYIGASNSGSPALQFSNNAGTERARLSDAGGFSVGTTADPGTGAIFATGDITAFYSDDRLKNRLGNIDNALSKILTLNGFYYEPNQTAMDLGYEKKKQVGVSAQEVKEVLPEVVVAAPIDDKYMTVHYHKLVPLLIEAIKELNTKIEDMQKIIESKG